MKPQVITRFTDPVDQLVQDMKRNIAQLDEDSATYFKQAIIKLADELSGTPKIFLNEDQ